MKRGRKIIICSNCQVKADNYGFMKCSKCLRNYKRKTRPSFYLGTCYSEISRRIKTFDPKRPNYFGLDKCTKEEFFNTFLNDPKFLELYKNWQNNGYNKMIAPSIDRIDNKKGYIIGNMQFLLNNENSLKDKYMPVLLTNIETGICIKLKSQREAAEMLTISNAWLCKIMKGNKLYGKYKAEFIQF